MAGLRAQADVAAKRAGAKIRANAFIFASFSQRKIDTTGILKSMFRLINERSFNRQ
jgi:hypothetical protein